MDLNFIKQNPFLSRQVYARLNAGQKDISTHAVTLIKMHVIAQSAIPFLNIYLGERPYPTGMALIDVGNTYARFTPMVAA